MDCCSPIQRQQLKMANTGSRKRATWDHLNGLLQPHPASTAEDGQYWLRKRATWDHLNGLLQPIQHQQLKMANTGSERGRHGIISMDCCSPIQRQQLKMANTGSERGRHGIISMDCCSPIQHQWLKKVDTGSKRG